MLGKSISDESARLQMVREAFCARSRSVSTRIGVSEMDDAALIAVSDVQSLVIASDFIRGSEFYLFQLGHMDYFDVGYYLVIANISDIAAMGAEPRGLTTIVRYSPEMTDDDFRLALQGIAAAAAEAGVDVVGGDIGGYRSDVFAATAFGFVETSKALLRSGAQRGDLACVTGTIGLPVTALLYFKETKEIREKGFRLQPAEEERLLASWRRPTARVKHGMILSRESIANACQDISDGLKATIEQLGTASGVTFSIYADKLPIDDSTRALAEFLGVTPAQIAVSASVDFELLFTIPPSAVARCTEALRREGLTYHVIGEVNELGRHILIDSDGTPGSLPGVTWRHQAGDYLREILQKPRHGLEESRG